LKSAPSETSPDAAPAPGAIRTRAGYVAILGLPNVGKSSLLNRMLGEKISITSAKPQTTRRRIAGIYSREDAQVVFVDTPGLLDPRYPLQQALAEQIEKAVEGVDLVYLMRDVSRAVTSHSPRALSTITSRIHAPVFLVLNKIDLVPAKERAAVLQRAGGNGRFAEIHPVSATTGMGVDDLLEATIRRLPLVPFFFDPEELTDRSMRFLAAELVRETLFEELEQELPYAAHVEVTAYDESKMKPVIEATIYVERESQKGIVIGQGGATLKKIGIAAREKIERLADHSIFLQLHVKVRHNWRKKEVELRRFGYRG
jgi:GTP-binding protein Era